MIQEIQWHLLRQLHVLHPQADPRVLDSWFEQPVQEINLKGLVQVCESRVAYSTLRNFV